MAKTCPKGQVTSLSFAPRGECIFLTLNADGNTMLTRLLGAYVYLCIHMYMKQNLRTNSRYFFVVLQQAMAQILMELREHAEKVEVN